MKYLLIYSLLLAAGLIWLARWLNPATVAKEVIVVLLIAALGIKVISLYDHE